MTRGASHSQATLRVSFRQARSTESLFSQFGKYQHSARITEQLRAWLNSMQIGDRAIKVLGALRHQRCLRALSAVLAATA